MFGFLRRKQPPREPETTAEDQLPDRTETDTAEPGRDQDSPPPSASTQAPSPASESVAAPSRAESAPATPDDSASVDTNGPGALSRFRQQLARTRSSLTAGLGDLLLGKKRIDDELLEEIETRLLMADVGQTTTLALVDELTDRVSRNEITQPEALFEALCTLMVERLDRVRPPVNALSEPVAEPPKVILVCGINGAGKTTTIGKLAHRFQQEGRRVMLAAGDTFRAAAVEQLIAWGERNNVPVMGEPGRSDAASVLFDAIQSARARKIDLLIADTAGRLHTQGGLMDELKKLARVAGKAQANAPHEVLLVLDASIGQNALNQARQFHAAVGVTGLIVTKLDGTAKGGIVFAIAEELGIPIRYLGVGEQLDDLEPFEPRLFVDALLDREPS